MKKFRSKKAQTALPTPIPLFSKNGGKGNFSFKRKMLYANLEMKLSLE
ncbi:hypothetical protein BGP_3647 [Beggiatoa sp. PS]|nr:hypothetical protein BGP_3647 [Beggiatoa sp. PS]